MAIVRHAMFRVELDVPLRVVIVVLVAKMGVPIAVLDVIHVLAHVKAISIHHPHRINNKNNLTLLSNCGARL